VVHGASFGQVFRTAVSGQVYAQPLVVGSTVIAFADGQVHRPDGPRGEWDGSDLAALAGDHQGAMPALDAQGFDASAGGLGDAQNR